MIWYHVRNICNVYIYVNIRLIIWFLELFLWMLLFLFRQGITANCRDNDKYFVLILKLNESLTTLQFGAYMTNFRVHLRNQEFHFIKWHKYSYILLLIYNCMLLDFILLKESQKSSVLNFCFLWYIIPEPTFTTQILPILTNHNPPPLSERLEPLI